MPRLTIRPVSTISKRDISPIGASRFERPMSPSQLRRRPFTSSQQSTQSSSSTSTSTSNSGNGNHSSTSTSTSSSASPRLPHISSVMISSPTTSSSSSLPQSSSSSSSSAAADYCSSPNCLLPFETWFAQGDPDIGGVPSDLCPDRATLASVGHLPVYDSDNNPRPFSSLYDPSQQHHERQLIVFVRHFFCGACQAYLKALTEAIPVRDYFAIPVPTSITVIGCGQPHLIPHYRNFTGCPFKMYADPSRRLFRRLGMGVSVNIGRARPEYMRDVSAVEWVKGQVVTVKKSLRDPEGIRKRDVLLGGNPMQIGGEFLFENGQVVWCHRMKNYRNHAEVGEVRRVLGLDE